MKTKILLRIAVAAIATHLVHAQSGSELTLQFLAFPKKSDSEPIELLVSESETILIKTPGHSLSPVYKIARPSSIVVGRTIKKENGDPAFKVLGKAPALASSRQIILLLRKGENESDGFVVLPIDGNLAKFSGGNYLFINASSIQVGGKIGDKVFKLQPGQREMFKPAATHEGGGCQATFSYPKDEKWKVFYDTRWLANERFRALVFFYQEPEAGKLRVAPIMDCL